MKFPLNCEPFAPLGLSAAQTIELERIADAIIAETIAEHEEFSGRRGRVVDGTKWRAVKSREDVTIYKANDGAGQLSDSEPLWSEYRLLAVGTIPGSLDDAAYGVMSVDEDGIKIKTSYVQNEIVDGRVLHEMRSPTEEDPFQFLGIKWLVKGHTSSVNAVVKARDLVVLDASGVHTLSNGERVGYHIMHSIHLPERCPELKQLGIVRGRISARYIFKQLSRHTVEVYMKTFVEMGGHVPDSIAIMTAANSFIQCWRLSWCAENKKLAWLSKEAARDRARRGIRSADPGTGEEGRWCCYVCAKTLSAFRKGVTCELCFQEVCSKCRTARKLSHVYPNADSNGEVTNDLVQARFVFCNPCLARSKRANAAEIAKFEHVAGALTKRLDGRQRSLTKSSSKLSSPFLLDLKGRLTRVEEEESETEIETYDQWERRRLERQSSSDSSDSLNGSSRRGQPVRP